MTDKTPRAKFICGNDEPRNTPALFLAHLVLDAAKLHEESYDHAQQLLDLDVSEAAKFAARAAKPSDALADLYVGISDKNYYRIDKHEAAKQVCAKVDSDDLADAVYLLIQCSWNESLDWAQALTGFTFEKSAASIQWVKDMDAIHSKYDSNRHVYGNNKAA